MLKFLRRRARLTQRALGLAVGYTEGHISRLEQDQEGGEECPVGPGEARSVDLALDDGELVAQRKNLDGLVHIAHRQQPCEGEHVCQGQVGQSQQHDRSSWPTAPLGPLGGQRLAFGRHHQRDRLRTVAGGVEQPLGPDGRRRARQSQVEALG
jgi:hypothetical protein